MAKNISDILDIWLIPMKKTALLQKPQTTKTSKQTENTKRAKKVSIWLLRLRLDLDVA